MAYGDEVLNGNPAAYWKLDETSGTTAVDETGNHDGAYNGSPSLDQPPLIQSGRAVVFDGTDDYVSTNWDGILGANDRTVAAWIQTTYTGEEQVIVEWGFGDTSHLFGVQINNNSNHGAIGAFKASVWGGRIVGSTDLTDGSPHFVVAVMDGVTDVQNIKLYVDGAEESISGGNSLTIDTLAGTSVSVGRSETGANDWFFNGVIDEAVVYDRALTAQEISDLYDTGSVFYRVAGTAKLDGSVGEVNIRALNFATNEVVGETTSAAADGTYELSGIEGNGELLIVAEKDGYRPRAHGPVVPEEQ